MTDQDNHLVTVQICILSVSVAPGTTTSTTCIHGIPSIYLIYLFILEGALFVLHITL